VLCSHAYLIVTRKISNNEQIFEEDVKFIKIFEDKLTTATEHFKLCDILDMSYKNFSGENGFLYLHTTSGVYTYMTSNQPDMLMKIYRELRDQS
jgi:hypothetical protein